MRDLLEPLTSLAARLMVVWEGLTKGSPHVASKRGFASGVDLLDWRLLAQARELPAFAEFLKLRCLLHSQCMRRPYARVQNLSKPIFRVKLAKTWPLAFD